MLPLQARKDLGSMVMKGYSVFPKVPALFEHDHQVVLCHIRTLVEGALPHFREAVGVFYSPSRPDHSLVVGSSLLQRCRRLGLMGMTLTGINTPDLLKWIVNIRRSLVLYPGKFFFWWGRSYRSAWDTISVY